MATLTYSDIETRCANHLRLPTTNSTEMTKLAAIINEVYRDIGLKNSNWWWLRKHAVVNTAAPHTSGGDVATVAATNGDGSVTFTGTSVAGKNGYVLLITGNVADSGATYRLTSTGSPSDYNLDGNYTGTTVTASAYSAYKDRYSLPTDLKDIRELTRWGLVEPLRRVGPAEMDRIKSFGSLVGKPLIWTILDFATTGDPSTARQLVVHPYPDATYRMDVDYTQTLNTEVSSTTRFLIPDDYIQVLIYGTLSRAYPIMLADANRGLYYAGLYNEGLGQMLATQRSYEDNPAFQPLDVYRQFYHRQRRRGHSTLRSLFGRYPAEF